MSTLSSRLLASSARRADVARRVSYADAGEAMRRVFALASEIRLKQSEWRVLSAVVALTGTYSKLEDEAYVEQIAATARVGPSTCRRALKKLGELVLIEYAGRRGPGRKPLIGLPKTVQQGEQLSASDTAHEAEQSSERKPFNSGAQDCSPGGATTEKVLREGDVVDAVREGIDSLGFTASQRARALAEDADRVLAWIERARLSAANPSAYSWSGIASGDWPSGQLIDVKGTHGTSVRRSDDAPRGPWRVDAYHPATDEWEFVGVFVDRDEAQAAFAKADEGGGATMRAITEEAPA
jgi:hypothetical protein